jgi:hypothetical protein
MEGPVPEVKSCQVPASARGARGAHVELGDDVLDTEDGFSLPSQHGVVPLQKGESKYEQSSTGESLQGCWSSRKGSPMPSGLFVHRRFGNRSLCNKRWRERCRWPVSLATKRCRLERTGELEV